MTNMENITIELEHTGVVYSCVQGKYLQVKNRDNNSDDIYILADAEIYFRVGSSGGRAIVHFDSKLKEQVEIAKSIKKIRGGWIPTVGEPVMVSGYPEIVISIGAEVFDLITVHGRIDQVFLNRISPWPEDKATPDWMEPLIYKWLINNGRLTSAATTSYPLPVSEVKESTITPDKRLPSAGDKVRWTKPIVVIQFSGKEYIPYSGNTVEIYEVKEREHKDALIYPIGEGCLESTAYLDNPNSWEFVDELKKENTTTLDEQVPKVGDWIRWFGCPNIDDDDWNSTPYGGDIVKVIRHDNDVDYPFTMICVEDKWGKVFTPIRAITYIEDSDMWETVDSSEDFDGF